MTELAISRPIMGTALVHVPTRYIGIVRQYWRTLDWGDWQVFLELSDGKMRACLFSDCVPYHEPAKPKLRLVWDRDAQS